MVKTYTVIFTPKNPEDEKIEVKFEDEQTAQHFFMSIDEEVVDSFKSIELIYIQDIER